jgi:hypothetical protein
MKLALFDRCRDLRTGETLRFVRWTTDPNGRRQACCKRPGQSYCCFVPADKVRKVKVR